MFRSFYLFTTKPLSTLLNQAASPSHSHTPHLLPWSIPRCSPRAPLLTPVVYVHPSRICLVIRLSTLPLHLCLIHISYTCGCKTDITFPGCTQVRGLTDVLHNYLYAHRWASFLTLQGKIRCRSRKSETIEEVEFSHITLRLNLCASQGPLVIKFYHYSRTARPHSSSSFALHSSSCLNTLPTTLRYTTLWLSGFLQVLLKAVVIAGLPFILVLIGGISDRTP